MTAAPGVAPARVLVVDDTALNRDLLTRRVEKLGHQVRTAENGRQALELVRAERFDVVLLDLMMPELGGDEVLRIMKDDPALMHTPVIMISALEDAEVVARCIAMGADDYLPKPFDPGMLKEIEKAIRSSDLGMAPNNDGKLIRLIVPAMSGEQRKKLGTVVKKSAEAAKVACRNIRRDGNKHFDDAEKAKAMTEDDRDKGKAKVQDQLKAYEAKIDDLADKKSKEVMDG